MDVNKVLKRLVKYDKSLPAIKLAWNCELGLHNCDYIPKVSPSHYKKEILLSTNERHSLLCNQQKKFELHKSGFEILAIPSILVFQNCTTGQKSSIKLTLRNVGKISQKATFFMDESYGFSIDENSQRVAKFAAGMTVTITVNFIPEDDRDHYHKLIISTKNSRFAIPIIAIGSRGIIDIPDMFDFGDVPVRVLKKQLVIAYNSGSEAARFTLTTDGHFSVKPERGIVAPKDAFSFEISFIADYVQQYEGFVLIKYDNDEEVHSICKANAVEANIYVCPEGFSFEDTYLGLKSRSTISIVNDSDEILDFKWIQRIASATTSTDSDGKEQTHHRGDGDIREWNNQGSRGENKNRMSLDNHYVTTEIGDAFYHENFLIEPLLGKIQPHTTTDVQAIFDPTNHFFYNMDVYLSITGLQDPIEVNVRGKGKGPEFKFNFDELDVGVVFVGGDHEYEVALTNIGQIEGTIKFDEVVDSFGCTTVSVQPEKMTLAPDQFGAFYVFVSCGGEPGDICERLKFTVIKSGHSHVITIKGVRGFPRMHFSTSEMYFGSIGYGFPFSQQVLLINDSLNTVMVHLEIEEEGTEPPMDYTQLIEIYKTKRLDQPASDDELVYREFTIEPQNFILNPRGFQLITVTICGHECRDIHSTLLLIITNGESKTKPILSLPIEARCTTPTLVNWDPDLFVDDAFLHYPNEAILQLKNSSSIPGCYYIVPVASDQYACGSPRYIGVTNANSTTEVPVTIIAHRTGKSAAYFDVYALGKTSRLLTVVVKYDAAAAKLTVDSKKIDFGEINVLIPSVQEIDIVNDSPLTIPYMIKLLDGGKNGEIWASDPERGSMDADSKTKIRFSVVLKEIGVHNALVRVQMQDAINSIDIKLTATGKGTSLTFDPPWMISHDLDFGYMFTKSSQTFTVEVTNNGHLAKCIEWIHSKADPPPDPNVKTFDRKNNTGNRNNSITKPKAAGKNSEGKSTAEKAPNSKLKEITKKPKNVKAERNSSTEKGMESNTFVHGSRKSVVPKSINRKESFIFTIVPQKKVLQPMTSVTIHFTAHSMIPYSVSESYNLWCFSIKPPKDDTSRMQQIAVPRQSRGDVNEGQTPYQESLKPMISHTANMTANFEIPKLFCSKTSVMFRIDAFPSQNDFLQEDTIKIENKGVLPLTGTFETKFPFSIQTKRMGAKGVEVEDLSEYAYTFQSKEQLSLTIKFDGQHLRKDRGTYNFDSELRISYLGHPEFTTVKLNGVVNFPQVILDRDVFDLGAIENGGEIVEEFTLTNPCNFCLTYKWFIKPRSTFIEYEPGELEQTCLKKNCEETLQSDIIPRTTRSRYRKKEKKKRSSKLSLDNEAQLKYLGDENTDRLPERKDVNTHEINTVQMDSLLVNQNPHKNSMAVQIGKRSKRAEHSHRRRHTKKSKAIKPLSDSKKHRKSITASSELDCYGDWVQFVRNKYFRSRMMEVMGLHDSAKEKEDETNYLHHHPFEPKTINNFAISQLLDIVPLAGIIQAGQTQSFMLVFYGHSNVKLKTTAICYIEGGASKPIVITAQSKFVDNRDSAISFQVETMLSNTNSVLKTMKVFSKQVVDKDVKKKKHVPITENEEEEEEAEITDKFKHRCAQRLLHVAAPPVKLSKPKSKRKSKKSTGLSKITKRTST